MQTLRVYRHVRLGAVLAIAVARGALAADAGIPVEMDGATRQTLAALVEKLQIERAGEAHPPLMTTRPCTSGQLQGCLERNFGKGVLLAGFTSDFAHLVKEDAQTVRVRIGSVSMSTALEIYSTHRVASAELAELVGRYSPVLIDDLGNSTLQLESLGSRRFFGITGEKTFDSVTPVQPGALVLCVEAKKILPLGPLLDITHEGIGYHPKETAQHPVYRYRSPCGHSRVIGSAVTGIQLGSYRVASKKSEVKTLTSAGELSLSAGKRQLTWQVNPGESGSVSLTSLGDLNGDGADDYALEAGNAGGGSTTLYLSSLTSWDVVASSEYIQ